MTWCCVPSPQSTTIPARRKQSQPACSPPHAALPSSSAPPRPAPLAQPSTRHLHEPAAVDTTRHDILRKPGCGCAEEVPRKVTCRTHPSEQRRAATRRFFTTHTHAHTYTPLRARPPTRGTERCCAVARRPSPPRPCWSRPVDECAPRWRRARRPRTRRQATRPRRRSCEQNSANFCTSGPLNSRAHGNIRKLIFPRKQCFLLT